MTIAVDLTPPQAAFVKMEALKDGCSEAEYLVLLVNMVMGMKKTLAQGGVWTIGKIEEGVEYAHYKA
jgi:hypothetical protein